MFSMCLDGRGSGEAAEATRTGSQSLAGLVDAEIHASAYMQKMWVEAQRCSLGSRRSRSLELWPQGSSQPSTLCLISCLEICCYLKIWVGQVDLVLLVDDDVCQHIGEPEVVYHRNVLTYREAFVPSGNNGMLLHQTVGTSWSSMYGFNPLGCVRRETRTPMSHISCSAPVHLLPV